jgi:hypothetical protein
MRSVGGIHRTRLAASNVHRLFVKEARRTVQKLGWQVPQNDISPTLVGAIPLPFSVPNLFEAAFGYKGNLRFVQFGYTAGTAMAATICLPTGTCGLGFFTTQR